MGSESLLYFIQSSSNAGQTLKIQTLSRKRPKTPKIGLPEKINHRAEKILKETQNDFITKCSSENRFSVLESARE